MSRDMILLLSSSLFISVHGQVWRVTLSFFYVSATGGVRKEFFMLLLKDLLDPKYGMFKEYEDSRAIWFADHSFEEDQMYILIGILCGLAIYNFTIINLPFPLCLYKK